MWWTEAIAEFGNRHQILFSFQCSDLITLKKIRWNSPIRVNIISVLLWVKTACIFIGCDIIAKKPSAPIFKIRSIIFLSNVGSLLRNNALSPPRYYFLTFVESRPGWRSQYSTSMQAGTSGDRIPVGRDFPHPTRPALGPIQPPVQWAQGSFT